MRNKNICIRIPEELKDEFQRDKHRLDKVKFLSIENLEQALAGNIITIVLTEVEKVTSFSSYGYVEKEGFFKDFIEWLDCALILLIKARGIDVSNALKKRDMYLALYNSQKQLTLASNKKEVERDFLIKQAEYCTHKPKDGRNYNSQIIDMCTLFIDIGLGVVLPEQLADICYDAYMKKRDESKQLIFEKPDNQ